MDRIEWPPPLDTFCTEQDRIMTVISCKRLDESNFAVVGSLRIDLDTTETPAGTVQIAELAPHDVIRLKKLEGENKNPIAEHVS